jgi:GPH family glycoside/pentoside/hexuronide:cation symporter
MMDPGTPHTSGQLPLRLKIGWGIGTLPMSAMFNAIGVLLLAFLVEHIGIAAGLAGLLILVSKIYDAVTDPLMGLITDRTKSRWGRRRPFLVLGGVLAGGSFIMMFTVPQFDSQTALIVYVVAALLLNATAYTVFNVPYLAMPAEMTNDPDERTAMMSYRVSAVAGGQIISSVLGPVIIAYFGGGLLGHSVMSVFVGVAIIALCATCFWMTHDAAYTTQITDHGISLTKQFSLAVQNRPFVVLLLVKFTQLFGFAIFLAALPLLFTRILEVSYAYLGSYYLFQAGTTVLSQPAWVAASSRIGKPLTYVCAAAIFGVSSASWVFGTAADPEWYIYVRASVAGVGAGGLLLIGQSLLPDTIEYDYRRTGLRREGIFAGVYTTVEKVSFAFGPAVLGLILSAYGWAEAQDGRPVAQTAEALASIDIAVLIPGATLVLSCLCLLFYKLDAGTLAGTQRVTDRTD